MLKRRAPDMYTVVLAAGPWKRNLITVARVFRRCPSPSLYSLPYPFPAGQRRVCQCFPYDYHRPIDTQAASASTAAVPEHYVTRSLLYYYPTLTT